MFQFFLTFPMDPNALDADTILQAWKDDASTIAGIEHDRVQERTPYRTGLLQSSLTRETNPNKNTIFRLYFDPDGMPRNYAPYQEGPPLGLHTYTNGPHEMVEFALIEDVATIYAWALSVAAGTTGAMAAAAQGTP